MVTKSKKLIEQIFKSYETFDKKRGAIIGSAIHVENNLTDIITWCFYPLESSRDEMVDELIDKNGIALKSLLLSKINFRDKIDMLQEAIEYRKPDILKTNKALVKNIVKELHKVRTFRNLVAHSESELTIDSLITSGEIENDLEDSFQVIEYKNGQEQRHLINKAKYEIEIMRMANVTMSLQILFGLFSNDPKIVKNNQDYINNLVLPFNRTPEASPKKPIN